MTVLGFVKRLIGLDSWESDADGFKGSVKVQVQVSTRLRLTRRKWLSLESEITSNGVRTEVTGFKERARWGNTERVDDLDEFLNAVRDHKLKVQAALREFAEAEQALEGESDAS